MLHRLALLVSLLFFVFKGYPQGLQDTVIQLKGVEVRALKAFNIKAAGMAVTSVDSIILLEKINLSLSELLSENTPVFIKNYGRGALATASFRGAAPTHTQVIWNGLQINSPMTGMVDFSLIPVYIIDEMELRSGPASIANRSGGLGGSVNLANSADWNNQLGIKYIQGLGSYLTFNEYLQLELGGQRFQSKTRAYHNHSKNNYPFTNRAIGEIDPETGEISNPRVTNDNADYTYYGLVQELYFRPGPRNILSARYWFQDARRTIPRPTSYEGPDYSNLNRQYDAGHMLVVDWKRYGDKNALMLRSGFSRKKLDYTLKNYVSGLGEVPAIYSESFITSLENSLSYNHNLTGSFSFEASMDGNIHWVRSNDSVSRTGYDKSRNELSIFMGVRKSFLDRLNLNLMLRQDWVDLNIVPVVPYFGFDWRIIRDQDLVLKGNIARNYHQPSLNDLYWQPGGNPDLMPEQGYSYELGLVYGLDINGHSLNASITAFRSDIDNWIIWLPGFKGYWEPRNIERVISTGSEFGLDLVGNFGKLEYKMIGNYSYTHSVNKGDPQAWGDESSGKQLPYIPLHSGNLMLNISYNGYFLTYQHNSYSERYTTSSNDIKSRGSIYPYFMNDLAVGKEVTFEKVTLAAEFKVYNLFDESYHTVLYRPMPGRNYMLVLMIQFDKPWNE
jgi:iron complex outermembrane receptor protein